MQAGGVFGGIQSVMSPYGPEAAGIADLAAVLITAAAVIFALVMLALVLAFRAPPAWLSRSALVVSGGIALPILLLTALLVYTLISVPRLAAAGPADVLIEVQGRQWWWEVHYLDAGGAREFATANEIRIPVGALIELRLRSPDVLHSFWVPALAGKLDLIPGRENRLRLRADRPGVFRGQCAEYCGGPHAQMALYVIAEPVERFGAWRAAQRQPQMHSERGGAKTELARGQALFLSLCAACHTVRGTAAAGTLGPDLTHVASRISLGAGLLPNNAGSLAGWIAGNQTLKPGNLMPEFRDLRGDESQALTFYLGALR